ncbi:MAG: cytochrome c3 family protein [Proteobacteria bacterium]|nr:cytochrome c3 family protein [Pseudomonadota bacterium]
MNPDIPTHPVSLGWHAVQLGGVLAAVLCLALCALPLRPRAASRATLALARHKVLGWSALAVAVAHALLLPFTDAQVLEHYKPSLPWYELAGFAALALLLVLTVPAADAVRRRIWQRHRNFQALHVICACLLVLALAVHVGVTAHYTHGLPRTAVAVGLCAAALLALLRPRGTSRAAPAPAASAALVFGRHSRLVLVVILAGVLALGALFVPRAVLALHESVLQRTTALVLDFPHEKHREVACVTCHHNFTDRTGSGSCIACHRSERPDLQAGAEARFHVFCLGCHRDPPPPLKHQGPVTGCGSCHSPPTQF